MNKDSRINPFDMRVEIAARIETLKDIITKTEELLKMYPDGKIHVSPGSREGIYRYFVRTNCSDKTGEYIHKNNEKQILDLCQKRYYEEVLKNSRNELALLERIMKKYEGDSLLKSYTSLSEGIRMKITPYLLDDETYTKIWLSQKYTGLSFDELDKSEHYTDRGERVRSKSEIIIANYLNRCKIPYLYEKPLLLKSGRTLYPDFTILDLKDRSVKYLEHLGKIGDVDYVMRNIKKLSEYKENKIYLGLNLFCTYENSSVPLSIKDVEAVLDGMGVKRENPLKDMYIK